MKWFLSFFVFCFLSISIKAADYQWSVPIRGKDPEARAFLWIPPHCEKIRGIILANQVILEKSVCDHARIRAVCAQEDLAIVILFRSPITYFKYKEGADTILLNVLQDLALSSGYDELTTAPFIPIGHSGAAIGCWNLAFWNPKRVAGILTLHAAAMVNPPEQDPKASAQGIPVMAVSGEYETWSGPQEPIDKHWRWLRGDLLDIRAKYQNAQVAEVVQPGAGHFNFDEHLANLVAMFIQKVARYRIPPSSSSISNLVTIPEEAGWLTDHVLIRKPNFPPAAYSQYKGDPSLAFWHMDEELAKAISAFPNLYGGNQDQRVSFKQHQQILPPAWITSIPFEPISHDQFKLSGAYLHETPTGVAKSGISLKHSNQPIQFALIGGWGGGGKQINDSVFQISFDHFGWSNHTNNIMFMAYANGDKRFKYAEQVGQINFPERNTMGIKQHIQFDPIQMTNTQQEITLSAQASSGLPVSFFVRSGPAVIRNNTLIRTPIPPRAKYPVKITVVAYQWGSASTPLIQSAAPVEQEIYICSEKDKEAIGTPYSKDSRNIAIKKIKSQIVLYAGSRYAWVKGYKMRLDDSSWQQEAIVKEHKLYVPAAFAGIISLPNIVPDPAPEYLKERWVYTIHRNTKAINGLSILEIDKKQYVSLTDLADRYGYEVTTKDEKLFFVHRKGSVQEIVDPITYASIITQFDSPEKLADPDIATTYIPMLRKQGKWTDHVTVTEAQQKILDGEETHWTFTPKDKFDFTGFDQTRLGSAVPAPGIFPRILFSAQDIPLMSERISRATLGQMSLIEIEHLLKTSWWDERTSDGKIFKKLYTGELDSLQWPDPGPIPNAPPTAIPHQFNGQKPGIYNSHVSYVPECLSLMALYCLLKNDDTHGRQAAKAIVNYFTLREPLIDEWNAISDQEMSASYTRPNGYKIDLNGNGAATTWRNIHGLVAHMNLGLSLDFAGKWMNDEEKKIMYRIIAKATYGRRAYGQDGSVRFRDVNWVTWDLTNYLALTAIEGQEGFDKEAYDRNVETIKAFCEWGIDSSGVIYESNGKTPGGMQFQLLSMIALARRGENLWGHPHIRKLLDAQVQMTSPTGTVVVNSGTQYLPFSQQQFSLQAVNEIKAFYPNYKTADYLLAQSKTFYQKEEGFRESMREWLIDAFTPASFEEKVKKTSRLRMPSPMYPGFVHGFLYDIDYDPTITRKDLHLPLDFNAPVHGVYSGYSDASTKAVWMNMMVRPNHYLGAGHHHADAGMFHFSALGVDWFTESPYTQAYAGKYHNQVLVDGISEAENASGTGLAYQAAASYLGMKNSVNGSFATADLTNAYTYRWLTQPPAIWDSSLASLKWELDPSPENLKIFAGTSRYKMRPWWPTYTYSNYIATSRALFNPMQYVYRTAGLIRGKHSYGMMVDDLKKDEQKHLYQWTAMLNGGVWNVPFEGLSSTQLVLGKGPFSKLDSIHQQSIVPKIGDPLLLVCVLNENTKDSSTIALDTSPAPPGNNLIKTYDRLLIEQQTVEGKFRILFIPFTYGEALPLIKRIGTQTRIQWPDGVSDWIQFAKKNGRTQLIVQRNGQKIAESL